MSRKSRIMMLWPGVYLGWESLGQGFEQSSTNHGLASISSVLKQAGHGCFMFDMRSQKGWEHFEKTVRTEVDFDICMIGFLSVDSTIADKAIRIVKSIHPNKPIIAGGVHLTYGQIKEFSLADTVVWGEGDEVALQLVQAYERGEALPKHVVAPVIKNLDTLPHVDRSLFNPIYEENSPFLPLLGKPFWTVNFSRGCNFSCSFCLESRNLLWKGQRTRSPEHVVGEFLQSRKGGNPLAGGLMIHDDHFPSKRAWVEKFIDEWDKFLYRIPWWCQMRADFICKNEDLIPDLARLGMTWCSLGIEGSQRMLDFYNKKLTVGEVIKAAEILHKNNINIFGNYIMGAPTETAEDLKELEDIVKIIRPAHHSSSTYTSYPGSLLYDYCAENNLFVGDGKSNDDYYSMVRYPYERKIVGVNYEDIRRRQHEYGTNYKGELRHYTPQTKTRYSHKSIAPLADSAGHVIVNNPKVTIIILSHNRPGFLTDAINSIFNQTIPDWELIIIDDFSTDMEVLPVIEKAAKDARVKAFQANYDVDNISLLWNLALDNATGEYVAFLDDDNMKHPDFCKIMSGFLDVHPEFDAAACYNHLYEWNDSKRSVGQDTIFAEPSQATKENILEGNKIDSGCIMMRRDLIPRIGWFDERLTTEDDWDYVIRIMHESKGFGIIPKPLAEYRWHGENRIYRSTELGVHITHEFITREKRAKYGKPYRIVLFHPDKSGITLSQNNVLRGVQSALYQMPWAECHTRSASEILIGGGGYDLAIAFMPFSLSTEQMRHIKSLADKVVTYQIEDPAALGINLDRSKSVDYIFTNDISTMSHYEGLIGKGFCGYTPSISFDSLNLKLRSDAPKRYEVVFYGYAYDSRVAFVKSLVSQCSYGIVTVVGGGWETKGVNAPVIGELSEQDSLQVMEEAKIVVLHNRKHTDCGGEPNSMRAQSVVRGYFECASGSLIMIDDDRPHHSLDGAVVFYSNVEDLVRKLGYYLANEKARDDIGSVARKRATTDYTYKTRITNLVNAVRSQRYSYIVK